MIEVQQNEFHWHSWFAWRPVLVPGPRPGTMGIIWFEKVERRRRIDTEARIEFWEYRAIW